jgi:hypothetical protein
MHVGRLGADAIGDGDLPYPHPGSLAVQQCGDLSPDPFAGSVELVVCDAVNRCASANLGDPVVGLGGVDAAMPHQLAQHRS